MVYKYIMWGRFSNLIETVARWKAFSSHVNICYQYQFRYIPVHIFVQVSILGRTLYILCISVIYLVKLLFDIAYSTEINGYTSHTVNKTYTRRCMGCCYFDFLKLTSDSKLNTWTDQMRLKYQNYWLEGKIEDIFTVIICLIG